MSKVFLGAARRGIKALIKALVKARINARINALVKALLRLSLRLSLRLLLRPLLAGEHALLLPVRRRSHELTLGGGVTPC